MKATTIKTASFLLISLSSFISISYQRAGISPNTFEFLNGAADAIKEVLKVNSDDGNSYIIFTDGKSSPGILHKITSELPRTSGLGIFEVEEAYNETNIQSLVKEARQIRTSQGNVSLLVISNNPQFLISFAHYADDSRLVVWETKILVVTHLPPSEIDHLMARHWTYSMFNTMFLNVVGSENGTRCDIHSYFPYSPDGGQVVRVAIWTSKHGLRSLNGKELFPEKYQNFHKSPMNVTFWPFMPYFMALEEDNSVIEDYDVIEEMIQNTSNDDSGKKLYTGRDYIMLQVMANLFNFTIKILPVTSWDEVIEKVIDRVSFISPLRIAILPHLLPYLDFSADFEAETLTFIRAKPSLKPRWQSLLYPLSELVWVFVGIMLLIVVLVLYLVSKLGPEIEDNQPLNWWMVTESVLATLLGQGLTKKLPNTNSIRLVVMFWLIFAFVIGVIYRGNLTAFLTLPKYPERIETLQQLVDAKASMLIPPDTVDFYEGFKMSPPGPYKDISQRMTFVPSIQDAVPRLLKENAAYMYDRRNLDMNIFRHFTRADGWTPLYSAKENIWPGRCAWPIIRDAPFRHILDRYIGIFVQAGLVNQWGDEIVYKFKSRTAQQEVLSGEEAIDASFGDEGNRQKDIQPLTVVHLQGPLLLLLLCLLASSLAFAAEIISGSYTNVWMSSRA